LLLFWVSYIVFSMCRGEPRSSSPLNVNYDCPQSCECSKINRELIGAGDEVRGMSRVLRG